MLVGEELAAWRKRHKLTQADLAKEVGVSQNTIVRWEMDLEVEGSRRPTALTRPLLERAIRRIERRGEEAA